MFKVAVAILHETVHRAAWQHKVSEEFFDQGSRFESAAFGVSFSYQNGQKDNSMNESTVKSYLKSATPGALAGLTLIGPTSLDILKMEKTHQQAEPKKSPSTGDPHIQH